MVSATGIGSGLDIESIVTQLVAAERAPTENRLNTNELEFSTELSAFGQFKSSLSSLESSLRNLASGSTFRSRTASSSNDDAITVSAGTLATPSSYQIGVSQLAQAHSLATANFSSLDDPIGEGTLTIRFGTTDYVADPESYNAFSINPEADTLSIAIDSTNNTLEGIRDAINAENGDVSAVIVNDGDGFRLLINSAEEGAENSLQISVEDTGDLNNTDSSGLSAFSFDGNATNLQQTIAAQDANLTVNGLFITSDSNSITGVIEGVSLDLNEITENDVRVSISRDSSGVSTALNSFISAYNSFRTTLEAVSGYDPESGSGGILQGDFTVRNIEDRLRSLTTGELVGTEGVFSYISEIGVTTDAQGNLTLDQARLNEALSENPDALEDLFAAVGRPAHTGVEYISDSSDTQVGSYNINITQAATRAELLGATIGFPLVIDDDNDNFVIAVNGESSDTISLTQGTYASGADLAAELQSRINGDDVLSEANYRVAVEFNSASGGLEIRTLEYGSEISLEIVSGDTNFESALGLTTGILSEGVDVIGTIGGQAATGIGQSLIADEGTDADGISLIIDTDELGNLGDLVYSRGIADQLRTLIGDYLDTDGLIDSREDALDDRLEEIEDQREALEFRLEQIEERYRAQFNALDTLLNSLNNTSSFLTQQLANLPGARDSS